ncbi:MAG: TetR family transcriptional regulator [Actinomycetales bacterium]
MAKRDLGSRDLIAADDIDADDLDAEISGAAEVSRREARRAPRRRDRVRMSGQERREQLLDVGRKLFAEKGFEAVSVEEIASKADVSKPVVYEHFGGKEGLYAVVVDREMNHLLNAIGDALTAGSARALLEQAGLALFDYIDEYPDGFRILVRDSPVSQQTGSFASLIVDVASQVEHLLAREFHAHKINARLAPMYSQMLVGMVALTGQWWLDVRKPRKEEVVTHLVNLAWNGLRHLEAKPRAISSKR